MHGLAQGLPFGRLPAGPRFFSTEIGSLPVLCLLGLHEVAY